METIEHICAEHFYEYRPLVAPVGDAIGFIVTDNGNVTIHFRDTLEENGYKLGNSVSTNYGTTLYLIHEL